MEFSFKDVLTIIVSIGAFVISWRTYTRQKNMPVDFSDKSHKIILNSANLALFDIDTMLYKVSTLNSIDYNQLKYQIESLEDNLSIIKDIAFTRLPSENVITYQVYRKDLKDMIYKLNEALNYSAVGNAKSKLIKLKKAQKEELMQSLLTVRDVLIHDINNISKGRDIYTINYKSQIDVLEQHCETYRLEYGTKYVKIPLKSNKNNKGEDINVLL